MARLFLLLFALEVALTALALISCLSAENGEVRALPRVLWVIVILIFPLIGSTTYFFAGRPLNPDRASLWRSGIGGSEPERPRGLAPDDDPEFLGDLRRRAEDLRKREETPPADG